MEAGYIKRKGALLAAWAKRDELSIEEEIELTVETRKVHELAERIRAQNPTWKDPYIDFI